MNKSISFDISKYLENIFNIQVLITLIAVLPIHLFLEGHSFKKEYI